MNNDELKLSEYLHNIIEDNMSLRKENDRLWNQKLDYISRIGDAIKYIHENGIIDLNGYDLLKILGGENNNG